MKIKLLENGIMPKRGRAGDAGFDVFLPQDEDIPGSCGFCLNTGICLELEEGYAAMFVPRSSSAMKGLIISDCLIDSNYRGEVHIIGHNHNSKSFQFKKGDRIASLLIFPIYTGELEQVEELSESNRGSDWNGSSGK